MAIGASAAAAPGDLLLALRGSGQALYVGLADDAYIVASEPYGVVEETDRYLRLDGETPADPANPTGSRGQVVGCAATRAGTRRGHRAAGPTTAPPLPVDEPTSWPPPQITTRDIDRGDDPHFLLKEITEAPASFRKTLRGKLVERRRRCSRVALGDDVAARRGPGRPGRRDHRRVVVIGQGTAAVAGQALAAALEPLAAGGSARGRGRAGHRAVGLLACAPTCPTPWSWRSASRAPPPTPTAPSTWCGPVARRSSPSSTAATATSPTRPTACSTPPTGATWR